MMRARSSSRYSVDGGAGTGRNRAASARHLVRMPHKAQRPACSGHRCGLRLAQELGLGGRLSRSAWPPLAAIPAGESSAAAPAFAFARIARLRRIIAAAISSALFVRLGLGPGINEQQPHPGTSHAALFGEVLLGDDNRPSRAPSSTGQTRIGLSGGGLIRASGMREPARKDCRQPVTQRRRIDRGPRLGFGLIPSSR